MGKTVVLSSHILSELAELCDSIGISSAGAGYLRKAGYSIRAQVQEGRKLSLRACYPAKNRQKPSYAANPG